MPRDQHYHQAANLISNVLGADAAAECEAFRQSVEQIARLAELAETYQDFLAAASVGNAATTLSGQARAA